MTPPAEATSRDHQVAWAASFSAGARAGGVVIALGYLLGMVPGPVVAVVGGLALVTFGRNLLVDRRAALLAGAALAVVAGALGVAALRWGALDLGEIRGVQSVLGPSVLVGPTEAAAAAGIAAGAALIALAVWLSSPWPNTRTWLVWSLVEAATGAFAIVTVFFDPASSSLEGAGFGVFFLEITRWLGAVALAAALATGLALLIHRLGVVSRVIALALSGAAVVASAALLVSVV